MLLTFIELFSELRISHVVFGRLLEDLHMELVSLKNRFCNSSKRDLLLLLEHLDALLVLCLLFLLEELSSFRLECDVLGIHDADA